MTDEYIVELVSSGNAHMFSEIVSRYKDRVYSLIIKLTGDNNEVQDLAQEVFVKVYREIGRFENRSSFSTWIYKVTYNTCIDFNRKNKKKFSFFCNMEDDFDAVDPVMNVEDTAISNQTKEYIKKQLYDLSDKYRYVIILYHYEGLSYEKISDILNIPIKTVETRLYRGRNKLRKSLEKYNNGGDYFEMQLGEKVI